ncbi:ATP-binding protein [Alkalihalobacillus sp. MEB130]|uniref:ATP-binding protein n=1 Tax=Alkalihalobacillus sp. MEB130 TaxID=2976704 RepID=UPI0028DF4B55|nr:ATP-binding protein [Alkalihalobacillus sp. MEB130]MDT8860239.1 ATP-binding protein [Alkalihalobacillus sp. MEB130]
MTEENQITLTLSKLSKKLMGRKSAHVIYMYYEYEKYLDNAFLYIAEGIERGDQILLFEEFEFYQTIIHRLRMGGFSEREISTIAFHNNKKFYRADEEFSSEKTIKKLTNYLKESVENGLNTRVWGHVLAQQMTISELRKYEYECDKFLNDTNIISICTYNGLTTPAYLQNELLKVHEYFMLDHQIEKSPFYHRNYVTSFSDSEMARLTKLERENEDLKKKNEQLIINQARQKEREKYLEFAREHAERANKEKSAFLSQMSHDLRTPLNTIQGYIQIMQMSEGDAELQRKIKKIYDASEQLLHLIEEILDFTVIDSGNIDLKKEKIQLNVFLKDCVESILEINDSNVHIYVESIPDDMVVEGDHVRFNQIITNLVTNAIKYNQPHGQVIIFCTFDNESDHIQINIKDNGFGIKQEELDSIFEPFYRSKSTVNASEGTGLGLAIVAQLTKRMQGTYGVTSELGFGSTFWVSFKRAEAKIGSDQKLDRTVATLDETKVTKVLYIEDNPENREVMHAILKFMDHVDVTFAKTGKSGVAKVFELKPDVVLLDLNLPDINGFQVMNKLKSNPVTRNIPIVAVSADAVESTIKRALLEGCAAYVTKPIDYKELARVLRKITVYHK